MNHKIAPKFNGQSWFMYCEQIKDWQEITVVKPEQQGPHLRGRLVGRAAMYRRAFDRTKLCSENGLEYFLRTLKFIKTRKHGDDILSWMYKGSLIFERLEGAWKDLHDAVDVDKLNAEIRTKARIYVCTYGHYPTRSSPRKKLNKFDYTTAIPNDYMMKNFPFIHRS